jgi:sec-independent protein translocase protein TatA
MPNIGMQELLVIGLVCVLLFGAKRIPEVAKGIGKSIKEFKGALKSDEVQEIKKEVAQVEDSIQKV